MNQREIIRRYIESIGWVHEYKVHGINTPFGFIGARGDRNVRQMIKDGILEAKMDGKYRIVRVKPRIELPRAVKGEDSRQNKLL